MDDLRQTGLLKNLGAMDAYCWQHGGSITEDRRSYGYIAETENYRFCLRCTPFPGEYQGYLYCYDLCQQEMYRQEHPVVGRVTFASGEQQEFTDSKALLQAIREELPFRSTTGFRFETLTDDPEVKKAVDDILLDFAGEDNSRRTCNYGLTETGKQALRKAADPSIPHTYAWFVMADTNTPQEIVSNTSAKERQHKCEVLISEAMGIASVQNPFTDRNMPYEQPFQPDAGDAEAVPIFVILSPIC